MIADKYNIIAYMNRDFILTLTFDIDISTYEFIGAVQNEDNKYNFTITKIDDYSITLELSKETINAYFEQGVYSYDLLMNDGLDKQILEGKFYLYGTIA